MQSTYSPLAERLRPKHWKDIIGQEHLLGKGGPLRLMFESGTPHSMILWGPPGVGKTTIARLYANCFDAEWIALSAVLSGVKDIRLAIESAKNTLNQGRRTLLFIDEIHRFNKSQQDALLPFAESGLLTIIGATTENPSFEVNAALLSRSQVYVLKALTPGNLFQLYEQVRPLILENKTIDPDVINILIELADGDARKFINFLEQIQLFFEHKKTEQFSIKDIKKILSSSIRRFDKKGEQFFDQISALHKSVRGSHPDAALYWFCRMVDGGADLSYLSRRILRMASEDIGLADPRALQVANEAAQTYERLGSPEGELALAEAIVYLAVAPKSNAIYRAFKAAMAYVKQDASRDVPLHLRNAPTALMKDLEYGKYYRYAHDEPEAYAAGESYLPDNMTIPPWYIPTSRGLEIKIAEKLAFLKQLDEKHKKK